MAEDLTRRLPAETLNQIIDLVDERSDLYTTAHVCRRWRHVAFDQPRRFCWYDCRRQIIPRNTITVSMRDPSCLPLAFAQIKCPVDHPRQIHLALNALDVITAHAFLKHLSVSISRTTVLRVSWHADELTEAIYDALASPAPLLENLALIRTSSTAPRSCSSTPRIPRALFAGVSPVLREVFLAGTPLPEQPLLQFSAVTGVSVDPETIYDESLHFLDRLSHHFPSISSLFHPVRPVVHLTPPPTIEGRQLIGRLTTLAMNECILSDMLDECPELSETPNIVVKRDTVGDCLAGNSQPSLAMRILERMLAHFAHSDFTINANHLGEDVKLILARRYAGNQNRRREISVPRSQLSDGFGGIVDRARADSHKLSLTRVILSDGAFSALWPVLPPDRLGYIWIFANPALPEVPSTVRPRNLPLLREFVITYNPSLPKPVEPIILRARDLNKFMLATMRVTDKPIVKLRLAGVSLNRVTPAIKRIFTEVAREEWPPFSEIQF